jgi:hypothetical protein
MHLSRAQYNPGAISSLPLNLMCPYWKWDTTFCSASVMTVAIDTRRKALYCCNDDHDRCAIFLAKVLRGT